MRWPGRAPSRALAVALAIVVGAPGRAAAAAPAGVTPPEVIERATAVYPAEALANRREADVVVELTIDVDGTPRDAVVVASGGEAFDAAALAAARAHRFRPGLRDGVPVATRIRIPFPFRIAAEADPRDPPPATAVPAEAPSPSASAGLPSTAETQATAAESPEILEATVRGQRTDAPRSTGEIQLDRDVLALVGKQNGGEILAAAPGVYVARPEGEAVAHEIYLRGFQAAHGQDVELSVGGIPINQISHLHGQGYADLNFLIPEVVRSLRVSEGVHDPRQGDFAVAGSAAFDLGLAERGLISRSSYGSFGTLRQMVAWGPRKRSTDTFAAFAVRDTAGFGRNRGGTSGSAIAQFGFDVGRLHGVIHAASHGARASSAGVLRRDDVAAGAVGFYDVYPNPSATAQSGFGARHQLGLALVHKGERGARTDFGLWLAMVDFHSRVNFTGFRQRSDFDPSWVGRGDLVEQSNLDLGLGARASHRTRTVTPTRWLQAALEVGTAFRAHKIDQKQNLLATPGNRVWDRDVDATIVAADVGAFADLDLRLGSMVRVRGGGRVDVLHFDVDDRLGNFVPSYQQQTHLPGFHRTALGVAAGPRTNVEVAPLRWLTVLAAYGEGYRSPQARQLAEGERAPFAKVRALEGGVRLRPGRSGRVTLTASGFATFLARDLAFDPSENRLESIGATRRAGFVAHLLARPWPWAVASISATYVNAILTGPAPATVEDPAPPYRRGALLPYVPPWVVRSDLGVRGVLARPGGRELTGRLGSGLLFLSPRPLPYGEAADPVYLLDLSAGLGWSVVELGVDLYNVLARRYAATEYSFVSDWGGSAVPSMVPARHFAAGPPFSALGTLTLHL